jgi:hypothetical protein
MYVPESRDQEPLLIKLDQLRPLDFKLVKQSTAKSTTLTPEQLTDYIGTLSSEFKKDRTYVFELKNELKKKVNSAPV